MRPRTRSRTWKRRLKMTLATIVALLVLHVVVFLYLVSGVPATQNATARQEERWPLTLLRRSPPQPPETTLQANNGSLRMNVVDISHFHDDYIEEEADYTPERFLFVGVLSTATNKERRAAVRGTWMQSPFMKEGGGVVVRFFVGGWDLTPETKRGLEEEMEQFGDLVTVEVEEDYRRITRKTVDILNFGWRRAKAEYVLKVDDDTIVFLDRVFSYLQQLQKTETMETAADVRDAGAERRPSTMVYTGYVHPKSKPYRKQTSKWYLSPAEFEDTRFPPFANGAAYIVSGELAKLLSTSRSNVQCCKEAMKELPLEDVTVGIWVDHLVNVHQQDVKIIHDSRFHFKGCIEDGITGHYIDPERMKCIWANYALDEPSFCCDLNNEE
ncbi:hypothetical protein QOT17_017327 [Balamuthia mandrillaris]